MGDLAELFNYWVNKVKKNNSHSNVVSGISAMCLYGKKKRKKEMRKESSKIPVEFLTKTTLHMPTLKTSVVLTERSSEPRAHSPILRCP